MKQVIAIALSYVGQKEIKGNKGFEDKEFEKRMKAVGFQSGWAWCCLFAELCFVSAFVDKKEELTELFSASVTATARNFNASKNWNMTDKPSPGALAIFRVVRNGRKAWQGHIGIVEKVAKDKKTFTCIEGNANSSGGREGIEVAIRKRKLEFDKPNGLVLQGFIVPVKEKSSEDEK